MQNIVLFDTSCGSQNLGDYIINESIEKNLAFLVEGNFCVRYPTHTPLSGMGSRLFGGQVVKICRESRYKFLCGTNLLSDSMLRPHPNWSVNMLDCAPYRGSICVGVGSSVTSARMGLYERALYKRILSSDFVHSVRDERTEMLLRSLGLKAVNTGCPTTWLLDQHAVDIVYDSRARPRAALFTVTDYAKDPKQDSAILQTLLKRYKSVLFWPQGSDDYEYLKELGFLDEVKLVQPSLSAYRNVMSESFDYVGSRLHGGIYALSHGHRTIILAVDHRALDMAKTSGIPVIRRDDAAALAEALDFSETPKLHIPTDRIEAWKKQFKPEVNG